MAKNKKNEEAEIFYDLDSWLQSTLGQNAMAHDNLNIVRELGFGEEADRGKSIHNLEQGLREVAAWASSHYGLYPEFRKLPGDKGTKIVFRPRGSDAKDIQDDDCPFIEIARTGQNGSFTIRDGILSPNSPILVRGRNGSIGLASVMSTEIAQILDDWKDNDARIKEELNKSKQEGLRYLRRSTSRSAAGVKQMTAGVFSNRQLESFSELNDKSVNNLRPEALWAMMSHVLTGYYQRSMYKAHKDDRNAPTEQRLTKDMEDIMAAARGFQTPEQVSNYVRQNYSWIYKNIWKGDFENVFKSFAGKMSQSGMTEGTVGKFGLMEVEVALQALQAPGKKLKQNVQVFPQLTTYLKGKAKAATGMTSVMSKNQLARIRQGIKSGFMNDKDIYKDVYTTAFFSKKDLEAARKELATLYSERKERAGEIKEKFGLSVEDFEKLYKTSLEMGLKGFGADASFMGEDLAKEFAGIVDPKHLKDGMVTFSEVNESIKESVIKEKQKELEKLEKSKAKIKGDDADKRIGEIDKKIADVTKEIATYSQKEFNILERSGGKYVYAKLGVYDKFQKYIRKAYGLDDTYKISQKYQVGEDDFLTGLIGTRERHNSTSVFRAGATADERTTKSLLDNLTAAAAMYAAGYSVDEIFRDANAKLEKGGGLRAQNFIENAPLTNKNIRSRIMQVLTHVNTQLRDKEGKSAEDIAKYYKDDPFFGKFFKEKGANAIFSIDKETGMFLVDNEALYKRLEEKKKTDSEFASNMLLAAVRVGQSADVYDKNKTYFAKRRANGETFLTEEAAILVSEELGASSSPEWMNLGRGGNTRSKIGLNELSSLEATVGDYSQYLLRNGYTVGNKDEKMDYDKAMAPLKNFLNSVRDQMADKKAGFKKYIDNAQYLEKTFSKEAERFQKDIQEDESVIKLTIDDLRLMELKMEYDSPDGGGMLVKDGALADSNLVGPYLARKRAKRFKEIQELKASATEWNKLSEDQKAKLNAIQSEEDLKTFGLDLGKERAKSFKEIQELKANATKWNKLSEDQKAKLNAIQSEEDLKTFGLDLGNERLTAELNGKVYDTKMLMLPLGYYNAEAGEEEEKVYRPDEGLKSATRILRSAKDYLIHDNQAFDRDRQAFYSISRIVDEYKDYGKEIVSGKTGEKYLSIDGGEGSGYLLLQGMTDSSDAVLGEILGQSSAETKDFSHLKNISRIISTKDLKAMLKSEIKDNRKGVLDLYQKLTGTGAGKKSDSTIIREIVNSVDISRKNKEGKYTWGGKTLSGLMSNRNPTINFINDLLGGDVVATSNKDLVARGRMLINKYYAAIGKGDMDGDLITMFNAMNEGDYPTMVKAYNSYMVHARDYQKTIQEEEAKADEENLAAIKENILKNNPQSDVNIKTAGKISKINSVTDQEEKAITVAAAWLGKQGAGRYGNAKFVAEDIIRETVGSEDRQKNNITSLGARVFGAVFQSLYQEGINIKNLKRDENGNVLPLDKQAARVYGQMLSLMDMATSSGTWDDARIMRAFFAKGLDKDYNGEGGIGVFKTDAMFKGAALETLGLNNITKRDKTLLNQLKTLAEQTKKKLEGTFGKDSPEVKQITADIEEIKDVQKGKKEFLSNLSLEMVMAILFGDYDGSFFSRVGAHGESVGIKMTQMFQRIPGYSSSRDNFIPMLGEVFGKGNYDEEVRKKFENVINREKKKYFSDIDKINKGTSKGYTSPSKELNRMMGSTKENIESVNVVQELANKYLEAKTEEEKEKVLGELRGYDPAFLKSMKTESLVGGLISHKVAEIISQNPDMNISNWIFGDEGLTLLEAMPGSSKFLEPLKTQLKFSDYGKYSDEKTLNEFIKKSAQKGVANSRILRHIMGENAISLGEEIPLSGYGEITDNEYTLSTEIADTIWTEMDENGNYILHIGDYKNPKNGEMSAKNALQLKAYERSIRLLQKQLEQFKDEGRNIDDASAFFAVGNQYTENWKNRLAYAAELETGTNEGVEYEKALKKRYEVFNKLLTAAKAGFSKSVGHIIATGDDGYTKAYEVDLSDDKLNDLFQNKYLPSKKSIEEFLSYNSDEANIGLNSSSKLTGVWNTSDIESIMESHGKELESLRDRYSKYIEAKIALNRSEIEKKFLDKEANSPDKKLKLDELQKKLDAQKEALAEEEKAFEEEAQKLGGIAVYSEQGILIQNKEGVSVGTALQNAANAIITGLNEEAKQQGDIDEQLAAIQKLVEYLDVYKKQSQEVANLQAALESPLLEGENRTGLKKQTEQQLAHAEAVLEKTRGAIQFARDTLKKDEEGNFKTPYAEEFNLGQDLDEVDKEAIEKAKQERAISDRRKVASYEDAVLAYEKKRYSYKAQLEELKKQVDEAHKNKDEEDIERSEKEYFRLKEIMDLDLGRAKNDLELMEGANEESRKNMTRLGELTYGKSGGKNGGGASGHGGGTSGNGGGGFLGINAAMSSWLNRLINGGMIYTFIRTVRRGFQDITNKAKQLDQAMTNLRIVTGKSASDARTLINSYADLGKELGATTVEVTTAATAWLRQGYDISQVNDLVTSSLYLSKLGMIDTATATQNLKI